jgi:hypothetical protein
MVHMKTLHIAPGDSAGGGLVCAIREAGGHDDVLAFPDDLSCGPIDPGDPSGRAAWWASYYDDWGIEEILTSFWERVAATDDRLVVWVGRRCARELAFFLAWTERLGDRPFDIIDVTGMKFPFNRPDGSTAPGQPAQSVSIVNWQGLKTLLGTEQRITAEQRAEAQRQWRQLRSENAPFRIVTENGLASAPVDHFDPLLLEQATTEWKRTAYVIGATMAFNCESYFQTGDLMLLTRVVALIEQGKLLVDGNPWDMQASRVRLHQA